MFKKSFDSVTCTSISQNLTFGRPVTLRQPVVRGSSHSVARDRPLTSLDLKASIPLNSRFVVGLSQDSGMPLFHDLTRMVRSTVLCQICSLRQQFTLVLSTGEIKLLK